jgi:hypothetical protein
MDAKQFEIESEAWYRAVAEGRLPAVTDRTFAGAQAGYQPAGLTRASASADAPGSSPSYRSGQS